MKILAIIGSASENSSNLKIIQAISIKFPDTEFEIFDQLKYLPHFDTKLTVENVPQEILDIRNKLQNADGVIISTPEYIFSIPSGLKNLFEWCVSTMIFDQKPVQIITASANGEKGHEELNLILKTLGARICAENNLLIAGIKGKFKDGKIDEDVLGNLTAKTSSFLKSIKLNF